MYEKKDSKEILNDFEKRTIQKRTKAKLNKLQTRYENNRYEIYAEIIVKNLPVYINTMSKKEDSKLTEEIINWLDKESKDFTEIMEDKFNESFNYWVYDSIRNREKINIMDKEYQELYKVLEGELLADSVGDYIAKYIQGNKQYTYEEVYENLIKNYIKDVIAESDKIKP